MADNWPTVETAEAFIRNTNRRLDRSERRASPVSASALMGPGMGAQAIRLVDWNDEIATFNGFFWTEAGALNTPVIEVFDINEDTGMPEGDPVILPPMDWSGMVVARDDGTGSQHIWNTDQPEMMYSRVRNYWPNPDDPTAPVVFSEWMRWATSTGFVEGEDLAPEVQEGVTNAFETAAEALAAAEEAIGLVPPANWVFYQATEPVSTIDHTLIAGDFWFDTDDDNRMWTYSGTAWVDPADAIIAGSATTAQAAAFAAQQGIDQAEAAILAAGAASTEAADAAAAALAAQGDATTAAGDAAAAVTTANAAAATASSAASVAAGADANATTALANAATAISTANTALTATTSLNHVYYQTTEPTGGTYVNGDLWYDTDDGNKMYIRSSGAWVPVLTGWLQTDATAARGIKITTAGLTAYNGSGVATLSINGTTGDVAMLGALTSGSTVTGATVTGGVVQTIATAARGVKITSTGLAAYDAGGTATFTVLASDGSIAMTGPILTGGGITGATITGGTVQTIVTASRGVKITTAGLTAYDGAGVATFSINASTGAVAMLGSLTSGSTVTGATITGGTVQTTATASRGVKITSAGLLAYSDGTLTEPDGGGTVPAGTATFTLNATTGALSMLGSLTTGSAVTGAVVTGGTLQTSASANTGVKITSTGIVAYGGGVAQTTIDATTGVISTTGSTFTGGNVTGSSITASGSGVIQTDSSSTPGLLTGIKMNSAGFVAYDPTTHAATFSITASTGAVAMKGSLVSGSTITGATIYGSTIGTSLTGTGARVQMTGGLSSVDFYDSGNVLRGTIDYAVLSGTNTLYINGPSTAYIRIQPTGIVMNGTLSVSGTVTASLNGVLTTNGISPSATNINLNGPVVTTGSLTVGGSSYFGGGSLNQVGAVNNGGASITVGGSLDNVSGISITGAGNTLTIASPPSGSFTTNVNYNTTGGAIRQVTSLGKDKLDKKPLTLSEARKILAVTPITWYDKGQVKELGGIKKGKAAGMRRIAGYTAEDVEKHADLFALYAADGLGKLAAVQYDRVPAALVVIAKDQEQRLVEQAERIVDLEARLVAAGL